MNDDKDLLTPNESAIISNNENKTKTANQIIWISWWGGTALIIGSWFGIVSNTIGWIGFALALASSFISIMISKYWKFPK